MKNATLKERGFSLVEILIGLAILSGAISASLLLFQGLSRSTRGVKSFSEFTTLSTRLETALSEEHACVGLLSNSRTQGNLPLLGQSFPGGVGSVIPLSRVSLGPVGGGIASLIELTPAAQSISNSDLRVQAISLTLKENNLPNITYQGQVFEHRIAELSFEVEKILVGAGPNAMPTSFGPTAYSKAYEINLLSPQGGGGFQRCYNAASVARADQEESCAALGDTNYLVGATPRCQVNRVGVGVRNLPPPATNIRVAAMRNILGEPVPLPANPPFPVQQRVCLSDGTNCIHQREAGRPTVIIWDCAPAVAAPKPSYFNGGLRLAIWNQPFSTNPPPKPGGCPNGIIHSIIPSLDNSAP